MCCRRLTRRRSIRTAVTALDDPSLAVAVVDRTRSDPRRLCASAAPRRARPTKRCRWRAPAPSSATITRRCRRAPCGSSAASTFRPTSATPATRRSTASRTPTAAAPPVRRRRRSRRCRGRADSEGPSPRRRSRQSCRARPADTRGCSPGITTGKANLADSGGFDATVNPGGTPLYRNGRLLGGVGVAGVSADRAEFAAVTAAAGSGAGITPVATFPGELPSPGAVFIDGIRLPFFRGCLTVQCVRDAVTERPAGSSPGVESPSDYLVRPRDGQPAHRSSTCSALVAAAMRAV